MRGVFTGQGDPSDPASMVEAHRATLVLAGLAEDLGFDSVWLSEHHFAPDGYVGALFPVLGALAARTERIVLGTRVALAPLYQPLRLAEDAAEVALLAGGRLVLGLGAGYHRLEFDAVGIPLAERQARLLAAIGTCRSAWTGRSFSTPVPGGPREVRCTPGPPDPPELWLGGRADRAVRRAAALADGFVAPLGDTDDTRALLRVLDGARSPGTRLLPVASSMLVAVDGVAGGEAARAGIATVLGTYAGLTGEGKSAPRNRGVAAGRPEDVARALAVKVAVLEPMRTHHLVVRLAYPGMKTTEIESQMRSFASDVAPLVRDLAATSKPT